MKTRLLRTFFFPLALFIQEAHAEHRLFPTDILGKGEADMVLGVTHDQTSNSILDAGTWPGKQKLERTNEEIQFRYGLGDDWHVGAAWGNNSEYAHRTRYDDGTNFLNTRYHGQQNPEIWVKHGFVADRSSPFSLSGEVKVTPNTTGKGSARETAKLSGGWDFGNGLKAFAVYDGSFPDSRWYFTRHTISAGVHKDVTDTFTLIPTAYYRKYEASSAVKATDEYGVSLAALVRIAPDTYFYPATGFSQTASQDRKDGLYRWGEVNGKFLALKLYHLF